MRTNENPTSRVRLLCRALGLGLFLGLAMVLAVPGAAWAQRYNGGGRRGGGFARFQQRPNRSGGARQVGSRPQANQRPAQPNARLNMRAGQPVNPGAGRGQSTVPALRTVGPGRGMQQSMNPGMRQYAGAGVRTIGPGRGQQHLPQWWQSHQGLNAQQRADALRRQPGFQNLPPRQQQRLLNRLQNLNGRSPQQQQRMMDRNEMFERLSPERQQEVRGAAQAFNRMDPSRKQIMRQAFQQLRGMPPAEREQMLHSDYGARFSPQERTVLGNLLAVEPYQERPVTPYFGRQ